jgi:hypothetical protein
MPILFWIAFWSIVLGSLPAKAQEEPKCAPRDKMVLGWKQEFGETARNGGVVYQDGQPLSIIEFYASDETGTWSILATRPDGMMCIVALGRDYNGDLTAVTPPTGEPM